MPKVSPLSLTDGLVIVEALAIFAFAISGLLQAARKRLDAVGSALDGLLTGREAAATLLILREFMHHLGYASIMVLALPRDLARP